MNPDDYAALYAEVKGKIRWALQSSLPVSISYSEAMDWAAHYASDVLERYKDILDKPNLRPYTHYVRPSKPSTNGHLTKNPR